MYFIIDGRNNIQHPTKKHDMICRWVKTGRAKFIGKNLVQVFKNFDKTKTINCKFVVCRERVMEIGSEVLCVARCLDVLIKAWS